MQTSTLNPTVVYAANVWRFRRACVMHQFAGKMYQCDVRQYASYFQSIEDVLSSFPLTPHSTAALHPLELVR